MGVITINELIKKSIKQLKVFKIMTFFEQGRHTTRAYFSL